ncbi:c-type cytochrome [Shimazuella sp. AN120528]|uniref:c-type cytochrome n=1 Tax=Shimazuella soli TaxID=1892854 RepID=UPI001F0CE93E|nr:cytochrome c [Shimazuella soli]MCH5585591.1 c-type cytochrome [Shimazuella soli]
MKKRWLVIPIVSLFILLAACSTSNNKSETPKTTQQLSAEETLFQNHCSTCHGGNLEGGYGPALQHVGKTYSKEQILEIMKNGKGGMPSQSFIPKADREKLATWLSNKK